MADGIKGFTEVTTPNDADAIYLQTSSDADGYVTASNFGAYFGSASYTVETATENKTITTSSVNYLLTFTRQATDKTVTLDDATACSGSVREIQVTGSSAGDVIIDGNGAQTVGGLTTYTITRNQKIRLISDGSNWVTESQFMYDTGWVANSDWTNAEFTITHNLNANLSGLVVEFLISTDGTEANAVSIGYQTPAGVPDTGIVAYQNSVNEIKMQTGNDGLYILNDSGVRLLVDTESYYYRVVVYKQN
jgi:hypothetical protein